MPSNPWEKFPGSNRIFAPSSSTRTQEWPKCVSRMRRVCGITPDVGVASDVTRCGSGPGCPVNSWMPGAIPAETSHSEEQHVARVVVDVMPKAEILDPQGQAIVGALSRLGHAGVSDVRQGKRFELEVDDTVSDDELATIAESLLANTVIEDWKVTRVQ